MDSVNSVIAALEDRLARNAEIAKQVEEFKNLLAPTRRRAEKAVFEVDPRWLRNTHTRQREQFIEENLQSLRVRKFDWEPAELDTLKSLVQELGQDNWSAIAQKMRRSASDCKIKYEHFLAVNCEPWTKDEDLMLVSLATKFKGFAWDAVAREMNTGRTAAACFQRYQRTLNPTVGGGGEFSLEEDNLILEYMKTHSTSSWSQITADLGLARNPDSLYRRWKGLTRPVASMESRWTVAQDAKLVKLAKIYGGKHWVDVSEFFPDKSEVRCREHYQDVIKPGRKANSGWTPEEDSALDAAIEKHGVGNWSIIAKELPGRTDRSCLQRWKVQRPDAAKQHFDKKRLVRKVALSTSLGRELERTELTPEDLLKVMVPTEPVTQQISAVSYPILLFQGPLPPLTNHNPTLSNQ